MERGSGDQQQHSPPPHGREYSDRIDGSGGGRGSSRRRRGSKQRGGRTSSRRHSSPFVKKSSSTPPPRSRSRSPSLSPAPPLAAASDSHHHRHHRHHHNRRRSRSSPQSPSSPPRAPSPRPPSPPLEAQLLFDESSSFAVGGGRGSSRGADAYRSGGRTGSSRRRSLSDNSRRRGAGNREGRDRSSRKRKRSTRDRELERTRSRSRSRSRTSRGNRSRSRSRSPHHGRSLSQAYSQDEVDDVDVNIRSRSRSRSLRGGRTGGGGGSPFDDAIVVDRRPRDRERDRDRDRQRRSSRRLEREGRDSTSRRGGSHRNRSSYDRGERERGSEVRGDRDRERERIGRDGDNDRIDRDRERGGSSGGRNKRRRRRSRRSRSNSRSRSMDDHSYTSTDAHHRHHRSHRDRLPQPHEDLAAAPAVALQGMEPPLVAGGIVVRQQPRRGVVSEENDVDTAGIATSVAKDSNGNNNQNFEQQLQECIAADAAMIEKRKQKKKQHQQQQKAPVKRRKKPQKSQRSQSTSTAASHQHDDTQGHFRGGPGTVLGGRYEVLRDVGIGTFGRVVECLDRSFLRGDRDRRRSGDGGGSGFVDGDDHGRVAIKVVRNWKRYCDSAMIEARIIEDVNRRGGRGCSHCVVLHNSFNFRGHYCMVFESLGPSLYDFLKRHKYQPFPMYCIEDFAVQLLETLEFLHSFCLIHTDLKIENILLMNDRETMYHNRSVPQSTKIKLIDFGGACYDSDKKSTIINTRQYRAPEVILNTGWSMPSDMWSCGCILAELYQGQLLFATHDNLEHLALMERVISPFPNWMLQKARRHSSSQNNLVHQAFDTRTNRHRLGEILPPESVNCVRRARTLPGLVRNEADSWFLNLLLRILVIDPDERATAHECLQFLAAHNHCGSSGNMSGGTANRPMMMNPPPPPPPPPPPIGPPRGGGILPHVPPQPPPPHASQLQLPIAHPLPQPPVRGGRGSDRNRCF